VLETVVGENPLGGRGHASSRTVNALDEASRAIGEPTLVAHIVTEALEANGAGARSDADGRKKRGHRVELERAREVIPEALEPAALVLG
jgi:hypothetical protein